MLDLETLSTRSDACVIQIGAVEFNVKEGTGCEFFVNVENDYGDIDETTVRWWLAQEDAAREALSREPIVPADEALEAFTQYMRECKAMYVWGNGSTFDNVILTAAYERAGLERPWSFRGDRDMRTLMSVANGIGKPVFGRAQAGVKHNALDDARYQAEVVIEAMKNIGWGAK